MFLVIKDRVWAFIVVVLLVSWIVQYLFFSGMLPGKYMTLYMFVPALLAFIFFLFGKDPWKKQAALFTRRTDPWSWAFALIYPLFFYLIVIAAAFATGLGRFNPGTLAIIFNWQFLASFAAMVLIMAPIVFGEEYGWRGYLMPALSDKHGKIWAAAITGLVWGLWHIPSYYLTYSQAGLGDPVLLTVMGVVSVAVGAFPYAYLFYLNGNLLPCVLLHAVYDKAAGVVFFGPSGATGPTEGAAGLLTIHWPYAVGIMIAVGMVMAVLFSLKLNKLGRA